MAERKLTYRSKTVLTCPLCSHSFRREELLTGGGRMNAGELTEELHRNYLSTRTFGDVYPLIYPVAVCPECWYAAFPRHFESLTSEAVQTLKGERGKRKKILAPLFPKLEFHEERGLPEGVASYLLAVLCYEYQSLSTAPTLMKGLSSLRGAWLCKDLHKQTPQENYDYLVKILYRKAAFFYGEAVRNEVKIKEEIEEVPFHGPDVDNNYNFDGVLYITGVLQFKYGSRSDSVTRLAVLKKARSTVARIVGMGKSSRAKPTVLLELGRSVHKKIKKEMDALESGA